ncbi:MAG: hypothetical protein JJU18_09955 [Oceanicaulis sp.]|nr:hypothetical protein [Oceanicaulis sp.]
MMTWLRAGLASVLAGAAALGALWLAGEAGFEDARYAAAPGTVLAREGRAILYRAPVPGWLPAPPAEAAASPTPLIPGVEVIFWEEHALLSGRRPVVAARYRIAAETTGGADALALAYLYPFSPSHQAVVLHEALIGRNGEWIDITDAVAVTFNQTGLDVASRALSDQTQTLVRLPGVRRGDMVQITVSRIGNHRLGDRVDTSAVLQGNPLGAGHLRLTVTGTPGTLQAAPGEPLRREPAGPDLERLVLFDGPTPPQEAARYQAPWRLLDGVALVTRTGSLEPLASWTETLYRPDITPEVAAIAATIAEAHPDRAGRIVAALRYVQREIRYFALALGDAGYVPQSVTETLRLSEGDCKAKTLLLISILAALEVEAVPVLVHAEIGPGLDSLPHSLLAFDHVIAGVEHEGERFWLDPSRREQPGALAALGQHQYGWGLVGQRGETGLTWLTAPQGAISHLDVAEQFALEPDGSAAFSTVWTFGGLWAEGAREVIEEGGGRSAFARNITSVYQNRFAAADLAPEAQVSDRRAANEIVIEASGQVQLRDVRAEALRQADGETRERAAGAPMLVITPHAALDPVGFAPGDGRTVPIHLPDSRQVRHTIEVRLPEGWTAPEPFEQTVSNPAFDAAVSLQAGEGGFILTKVYRVTAGELELDALGAVIGDIKQTRRAALVWLPGGERNDLEVDAAALHAVAAPSVPPAPDMRALAAQNAMSAAPD